MNNFEIIKTILSDLSGAKRISPEHQLQLDLGLDSLQMVELLMMLEDNFDIVFDESDMNPYDLITVDHVINLVGKYVKENQDE